ncbi:MAG: ATP synthase F1 subunit delta [Acidimicrobiia bacterium]
MPDDAVRTEHRIESYARALVEVARAEGLLVDVEDDLFRFARVFEGSDDLRRALTDPAVPPGRRMAVVEDLMGAKTLQLSASLASLVVGAGRASDLPAIVDRFVALAAEERSRELAEVRSAVALTAEQTARLADALSHATGKQVEVKVIVDDRVMGGIVARIGDVVIDGTVRHRIEQLKERL